MRATIAHATATGHGSVHTFFPAGKQDHGSILSMSTLQGASDPGAAAPCKKVAARH